MKFNVKRIPNAITLLRIISACVLLFSTAYTTLFYVTFAVCVLSDILDGFLARLLNAKSERGARLDSCADFVFLLFTACVVIPAVSFPIWFWIVAAVVLFLKLSAMLLSTKRGRGASAFHNLPNKLSGLTLCVCTILLNFCDVQSVCVAVAVVTGVSAIYDFSVSVFRF